MRAPIPAPLAPLLSVSPARAAPSLTGDLFARGIGLLFIIALAASPPARAATPEKVAQKAADAAVAEALASYRTAEKIARASFDSALGAFEATLGPTQPDPIEVIGSLSITVSELQGDLSAALDGALIQAGNAHADAMTAFSAETGGLEPFPLDLLMGGGGAADRLRDGLRSAAAKNNARTRKRLAKTIAELRKTGLRAVFRLEHPRATVELAPNPTGAFPIGEAPLTIDVLIALAADEPLAGGVVFASGQAESSHGLVAVALAGSDTQDLDVSPSFSEDRWNATFGAIDLVDAGGEVVSVQQGTGARSLAAIGVP
jgi:hypothetical protein